MSDAPLRDFFPMGAPIAEALARLAGPADRSRALDVAADALGSPVDGVGWILHRMGVPVPGGLPDQVQLDPVQGRPVTWMPSADVPLSSAFFRGLFRDPRPALDALGRAGTRGLF